ncbi:MAG: alpha/beta hydrolase-fold protein [Terriglobales bacterium]|jgi:enterochelin esterase-like enzyme
MATLLLAACSRMHKEPFEKAPLSPGQIEVVRLSERANLVVERIRFWSHEMNEPRFFLALVPKTKVAPSEVLILNHGWWDRPEYLLQYLKVDEVYDEMLGRGEVRPAIVILPDVRFNSFYRQYSDRFPYPNYLTLVAEEVAGTVSRHYAIPFERQRWAIGGFSFGGYLSLDVGRRYAGRFASVSIVSGLVDDQWSFWPSQSPPPGALDSQGRGKHTIVVPGPVPRLFLACGTDDRLFTTMRDLHQKLTELGIPHEWSTGPGGHTWKYWSSVLPQMLKFHLAGERSQVEAK